MRHPHGGQQEAGDHQGQGAVRDDPAMMAESSAAEAVIEGEIGSSCPVLVLGMGNILLEDEGLGVHALNELTRRYQFTDQVEFIDGGTSGMALLDQISGRDHLLVLDAVQTGDPPGTLVEMSDDEVPVYFGTKVTFHQLGLSDVLANLELNDEKPRHVTVLGLVPESLELSLEMSATVKAKLDFLVEAAARKLDSMGCVSGN
jgi:hydrogenase maturation protease